MNFDPLRFSLEQTEKNDPLLILSQDYELFFQKSGTVEQCLIKPTDMLLSFAKKNGIVITFFIDAGMLVSMRRLARTVPTISKELSRLKKHIESLHMTGHEIALHVHPHWEDTRWSKGEWDFSGTRYRLDEFSQREVEEIIRRYSSELREIVGGNVHSYRAGGFCVEPFGLVRDVLLENGITVDSSVVPGAILKDRAKGYDFAQVADAPWWRFQESPSLPNSAGEFLEIPISPLVLPSWHYWSRAVDRVLKQQPTGVLGDGVAKSLGIREIARRLAGAGRISELSADVPKSEHLVSSRIGQQTREVWQIMGHPKLLGKKSLDRLEMFVDRMAIECFCSVSGLAHRIRSAG